MNALSRAPLGRAASDRKLSIRGPRSTPPPNYARRRREPPASPSADCRPRSEIRSPRATECPPCAASPPWPRRNIRSGLSCDRTENSPADPAPARAATAACIRNSAQIFFDGASLQSSVAAPSIISRASRGIAHVQLCRQQQQISRSNGGSGSGGVRGVDNSSSSTLAATYFSPPRRPREHAAIRRALRRSTGVLMLIDSSRPREKQCVGRDLAQLHAIHQALGAPLTRRSSFNVTWCVSGGTWIISSPVPMD